MQAYNDDLLQRYAPAPCRLVPFVFPLMSRLYTDIKPCARASPSSEPESEFEPPCPTPYPNPCPHTRSHAKQPWTRFVTPDNRLNVTPDALDLLDKLLRFNHHDRLTAAEALAHSYFSA